MKKLLIICLLTITHFAVYAQSHMVGKANYNCKLNGKNWFYNSEKHDCPACKAAETKKKQAEEAEDERKRAAERAKYLADQKAKEIARKKAQAEREANSKVTEVRIVMPSSSSSSYSSSKSSSTQSTNNPTETASSSATETTTESSVSASSNVTVNNNIFAAEAAKKYAQQKMITDAAQLMGDFFDSWQANRERKWAKEKAEGERYVNMVNSDREAYNNIMSTKVNNIFNNVNTYQYMLLTMVPKVLKAKSITWEDIIGAPDYNGMFGKNFKSVAKKLKLAQAKDKRINDNKSVAPEYLPLHFTPQKFYHVAGRSAFYYWVKTDFYEHNYSYIFNDQEVLVGIQLDLHTQSSENKSFPSSLTRYVSVKDYYEDLLKNTKGDYFLADGKTLITRDKIFILDFDTLTIYDLNYFNPNTLFNIPSKFNTYFNAADCNSCLKKLGFKFEGFGSNQEKLSTGVRITQVDQNSAAEKAGLKPGDIVLSVNETTIDLPFHLQWFVLAFPKLTDLKLKIEREHKTLNIPLTL